MYIILFSFDKKTYYLYKKHQMYRYYRIKTLLMLCDLEATHYMVTLNLGLLR